MTKKSLCQINYRDLLGLFRSSHWRCSVKENVPKKFANFTGKPLHWNLFLIKLQGQACSFVRDTNSSVFLWNRQILRTSILKNIWGRLLLYASPQNTIANFSGEFGLNEALAACQLSIFFKHNNFIPLNAAISFIHKLKNNVPLKFQLTFLLNFWHYALLKYFILRVVS